MKRTLWFLLFCCPVFFFCSFIQSCKAAVWCHQSQSVCTSCTALIGCNDLRMSLHTLICFSLWPICFAILPWAAGCLPSVDTQAGSSHAPFSQHYGTIQSYHHPITHGYRLHVRREEKKPSAVSFSWRFVCEVVHLVSFFVDSWWKQRPFTETDLKISLGVLLHVLRVDKN